MKCMTEISVASRLCHSLAAEIVMMIEWYQNIVAANVYCPGWLQSINSIGPSDAYMRR